VVVGIEIMDKRNPGPGYQIRQFVIAFVRADPIRIAGTYTWINVEHEADLWQSEVLAAEIIAA